MRQTRRTHQSIPLRFSHRVATGNGRWPVRGFALPVVGFFALILITTSLGWARPDLTQAILPVLRSVATRNLSTQTTREVPSAGHTQQQNDPLAPNAVLLTWNTFGNLGTETTEPSTANDPNLSAVNLTLGAGVTAAANANRFGGTNWFDTGDTNPTTLAESIAGNDYIQFIVTPNGGFSFTPTSLVFSWDHSSTGPASVTLRSSVDSFSTDLGSVTGLAASITTGNTITISGLTDLTTATTFRLYGYGATATGGTGGFDTASSVVNVQLNGSTAAVGGTGKMVVTLPGQTFTSGSGNSGTPTAQTAGTPFDLTLTATLADGVTTDTTYSGTKTISYSGPGGSPSYTTSVNFTNGQATGVSTTLTLAQTTTVTATDGALAGVASSSLIVNPGAINSYVVTAATPQSTGVAFNTSVTAKDANNNTVTTDNSTVVTMSSASGNMQFDSNGDTTFGDNTKTLTSGALTISTRDNVGETTTITAIDGNGKTGTSSNVVVAAPAKYRSKQTGNWNDFNSWQVDTGTGFVDAISGQTPTSSDDTIQIRSGHIITVTASVATDQTTVDSGGQITIASSNTLTVNNGAGTDLSDAGTILNSGTLTITSGGTWAVTATGTFIHNAISGIATPLNSATLDAASTFIYRGSSTLGITPSISGRTYGNLTLESSSGLWSPTASGSNPLTINGSLSIGNSGGGTVSYNMGGYTGATTVSGGTTVGSSGTLTLGGTAFTMNAGTLTVNGTFDQGASTDLTADTVSVGSGGTLKNLGTGDLKVGAGGVSNAGTINFNAGGGSCGDADGIVITSSSPGTQRTWSGSGTFSMTDVAVSDQKTPLAPPPAAIFVTSGTDNGNNTGWFFSSTCTAGTYTYVGGVSADWQIPTNWSPTRTVPAAGDILILDGNATPAPIITNVPTQSLAALRLINGIFVTLNASAVSPPQTLTLSGATGSDLSVPNGTILTLAGANGLKISVASGSTGTVGGQIIFQDGPHRLLGNAASGITFQNGALFTTSSGFAGNAFGTGGAGDGVASSVVFQSGSKYFHNAGSSPFGASPNPAVCTLQSGSEADFFTATGFEANGRTYGNLNIGKGDPGGVAVNASDTGTGNFQFDNLVINNTSSANSSLTYTGSGTSTITIRGNITTVAAGSGGTLPDVIVTAGSGGIVIDKAGGGIITFGNQFTTAHGIEFEGDATIAGGTTLNLARNLLLGIIQPSSFVMTVNGELTGSAGGYLIGNEKRSYASTGSSTYHVGTVLGYSPVDVTANLTPSGTLTVGARDGAAPTLSAATSLKRYWTLTGTGTLNADVTFHYNDPADIAGNENNYQIVAVESGNATRFPSDATHIVDTSANTFTFVGLEQFSDWTVAEPAAPTAVKLSSFTAKQNNGDVMLQWQSGYEARNLGYMIYREQDGKRVAITPSLVAGSALVAERQTRLGAGLNYTWYDHIPAGANATYWLEDVDLNGTRTLHGPIVPEIGKEKLRVAQRAELMTEVARPTMSPGVQFSSWAASSPMLSGRSNVGGSSMRADPNDIQHDIAGMAAAKIAVRHAGWYRVTQPELTAAGFTVENGKQLQLYRNGREVPLSVSTDGTFTTSDYIEFYGEGIDSPTDAVQTYYLINGNGQGMRLKLSGSSQAGTPSGPQNFAYTVERKERMIYFSGLRNGDSENFFGQIVTSDPASALMPVTHLDSAANASAKLEVVLQGVTAQSHLVGVVFNGVDLGTIDFANTDHPSQMFTVPASALHESDNTVQLTSLGGTSDVSLVDVVRLTYAHAFVADTDALSFSVSGGDTTRISGFTNANVRVIDISDASMTSELRASVVAESGSYAAYVAVPQASALNPHTLLAIAAGQTQHAESIKANAPSSWWSQTAGADYVIITTAELKESLAPLVQLRSSQGMLVKTVDVEDLYDEFTFGKHSPQAIRSFFQKALKSWKRRPHYVLFAGDASYDPKNYFGLGNYDLVPTKLIDTSLSETASDDWLVDFNSDGIADFAVGRLPVRTASEAAAMVNKIISYENTPADPSRGVLLVADTNFEGPSNTVSKLIPSGLPVQTINRSASDDATTHQQVITSLNAGPRLANYFGHGSNGVWTGASILSSNDAPFLTNTNHLSVFTMMTCFNGYFQDPYNDSLSEALLKSPGGAVAVWASTTLTEPEGQNDIGAQFYRLLFSSTPNSLGDASRAAKSVTNDSDVRRTWTLFGDPASRLR